MQPLRGFRDFFPADCALRNYIFARWRETCRRYGFVEFDGPVLEATDLYRKKSGDEVVEQLFAFTDKGDREVALRPELTPSLARMVASEHRNYRKPLRWFSIGQFFRYEKQQVEQGRLREFYQLNCDILGEDSAEADAELIALTIDVLRAFGLGPEAFRVRLSDRHTWTDALAARGIAGERAEDFLQIIDKLEREAPERSAEQLAGFGMDLDGVREFMATHREGSPRLQAVMAGLAARGLQDFVAVDLGVVRGLAYYTGVVFEVFDLRHGLRAVAGGGRYDRLISTLSDGQADLPAVGMGMGDVVLSLLLSRTPAAQEGITSHLSRCAALDAFVVVADESQRAAALDVTRRLREAGLATQCPLAPAKVGKQFQAAEQAQARAAVVIGSEYPEVRIKNLESREETGVHGAEEVVEAVRRLVTGPRGSCLLA